MGFINDIFKKVELVVFDAALDVAALAQRQEIQEDFKPGDINIESIILLSEDQQRFFDLMKNVTSINIYESIMSPCVFCTLEISDSHGLAQSFPIIGEEYVSITFKTPGYATKSTTYMFRVRGIKNKQPLSNNKMVTYSLQLVSAELIRNSVRFVNRTYDDNISNVIKTIMTEDLSTVKPISIDETVGIEKSIITRKQPLVAIDFLRRRAVSNEFKSSSFVFYENKDGYFFTTLEKLMYVGAANIQKNFTDKQFFFDSSRNENISNVKFRNILAYNQIVFNDSIAQAQNGGLTNIVNACDMISGNINQIVYTDNLGADQFKTADGNSSGSNRSSSFTSTHGQTTAITRFVPTSADKPNSKIPEKISNLMAYVQKLNQNMIQVYVYGDSELAVGDVITCTFPSATIMSTDEGVGRLDSGNYLIAKLRHIILKADRPQHTISLELIKIGLTEAA